MTTSKETEDLNHPVLRRMVDEANCLPLADRMTLLKGLVPGIATELTPRQFGGLIAELQLKGERFYEAVEHPGIEYGFAGDEHGRLTIVDRQRPVRLGERIEFFPPHCDPTVNLYDRVWCVRSDKVEAVWDIAARGRSD